MTRDPKTDDILSAYLDGELSEQQRRDVERRLADDADARRLLAEFQEIRAQLQGIPREGLEPAFRERVLERIEGAESHGAARKTARPQGGLSIEPRGRPRLSWRAILWPAMAVAVALMIMVFQPRGPHGSHRQVARRADEATGERAEVAGRVAGAAASASDEDRSVPALSAAPPADASAPPATVRLRAQRGELAGSPAAGAGDAQGAAPAAPAATADLDTPPAPPAPAQIGRETIDRRPPLAKAKPAPAPQRVEKRAARTHARRPEAPAGPQMEGAVVVRLTVERPDVARQLLSELFDQQQRKTLRQRREASFAAGGDRTGRPTAPMAESQTDPGTPRLASEAASPPVDDKAAAEAVVQQKPPQRKSRAADQGSRPMQSLLVEAPRRRIRRALERIASRSGLLVDMRVEGASPRDDREAAGSAGTRGRSGPHERLDRLIEHLPASEQTPGLRQSAEAGEETIRVLFLFERPVPKRSP